MLLLWPDETMQKLLIILLLTMPSILNKLANSDASIKRMVQAGQSSEPVEQVDWYKVQQEGDEVFNEAESNAINSESAVEAPIDAHRSFWGNLRATRAKIAAMYVEWDTTNKGAWKKLKSLYKLYDKTTSIQSKDPFLLKIVKGLYNIPIIGTYILSAGVEKLWDFTKTALTDGWGMLTNAYSELSNFLTGAKAVHEVREKKALMGEMRKDLDKLETPENDPVEPRESDRIKAPKAKLDTTEADALAKKYKELDKKKGDNKEGKKQYKNTTEEKEAEERDKLYETIWKNLNRIRNDDWKKSMSSLGAEEAKYNDIATLKSLPGVIQDMPKEEAMKWLKKYPTQFYGTLNTNFNLLNPRMKNTVTSLEEWKNRQLATPLLRAAQKMSMGHQVISKMDFNMVDTSLDPNTAQMGLDGVEFSRGANVDMASPQFLNSIVGGARIDGLKTPLLQFHQELLSYVPDAKITSAYRPNAITKGGRASRHGTGEAIDYGVNSNSGAGTREFLYSNQGQALLRKYGLNFIDESIPEVNAATVKSPPGAYHIGMDTSAANNRLNYINLDPRYGPKKPVTINRNFGNTYQNTLPTTTTVNTYTNTFENNKATHQTAIKKIR